MVDFFREFVNTHQLVRAGSRGLLAVSGGIDSVVMAHLFHRSRYLAGVAHCNFRLRGQESDEDEAFVRQLASDYGMEFHVRGFETEKTAKREHISIQMAARKLRYEWFEQIRAANDYDWIATAHNQDDVIETFFINLSRGTGIRGLSGIPVRSGRIIRPLLFASREQIQAHARTEGLIFREDSSNAALKYLRNKIRHQLIPLFESQNPSFRRSLAETIRRLSDAAGIYEMEMSRLKKKLLNPHEEGYRIRIRELQEIPFREAVLYELLSMFHFPSHGITDILDALDGPSGKQFFSPTHRLVRDREYLIISYLSKSEAGRHYLDLDTGSIRHPIKLDWVIIESTPGFRIPADADAACLDLDRLDFPLILRRWQQGDYFQPLGMEGMKKLSDFFIDEKLSLPAKEQTWLLCSGPAIAWIIGRRIDHRFRVTPATRQILMVRHTP